MSVLLSVAYQAVCLETQKLEYEQTNKHNINFLGSTQPNWLAECEMK